jgi:hypothetical protein
MRDESEKSIKFHGGIKKLMLEAPMPISHELLQPFSHAMTTS